VVLIWNDRRVDASPFMTAYHRLLREYTKEYGDVHEKRIDHEALDRLFAPGGYGSCTCDNRQVFDFEGLKGRLLSASYAPEPGHSGHEPMIAELARIFEMHQSDGQVAFEYDTRIYLGRLGA
jgi:hypothetical protein